MSDDNRPKQVFYNARELFSTPGYVPYYEGDKVTNLGPVNRELIHVGFWSSYVDMRAAARMRQAAKFDKLAGASSLKVAASVMS